MRKKLTNGVISSKSGYQGDVSTYQISAPVQPGNSGGPLFDSKGSIVGIVNAGVPGAENVGYAIKTSYLFNLVDSYSIGTSLPSSNKISSLALKDQVKRVQNYVFLLLCSSGSWSSSSYNPGNTRSSSSSSSSSFPYGTKVIYSKEATVYVGDRIGARLSEGTVDAWEISSAAMEYVAPTSNGTITAVKSGNVGIWGYINGSPKLFKLHIVGLGLYVPHDKVPHQVTTKEFSMYVGDQIIAKISDGEVTMWEIENHNRDFFSASGKVLTARKAGYVSIWGYIDSSPKLFKITIKSR